MVYWVFFPTETALMATVEQYRMALPGRSSRAAFTEWLNEQLEPMDQGLSVHYLRDLERGRKIPSLSLAVAIYRATSGVVSPAEWPGLSFKLRL